MLARAPGKVVISGAYAVLEGAPAIVSAVDRYVVADSRHPSTLITPEFSAASDEAQPYFDATQLRQDDQKLGLGSSAAILVACLGALRLSEHPAASDTELREHVYERAQKAHQKAQAGGSGIDVAASTFGGTLLAKRGDDATLSLTPITLSNELFVEVWATGRAASTSDMLARVSELKRTYADRFQTLMGRQIRAAETAAAAVSTGSAHQFIGALTAQHDALRDLGQAAGIPIVVDAVRQLHTLARTSGACVLPAGAGGGDISLYTGTKPPGAQLVALARRLGQKPLNLRFGVRGLHRTQQGTAQP